MCSCVLILLSITKDDFLIIQVTLTFYLFNEFVIFFFLSNTFVALLSWISDLFRKLYSYHYTLYKEMFPFNLLRLQKYFGAIISVRRFKSCDPCLDHSILCATKRRQQQSFSHGVQNWTAMKDAKIGDMPSSCKNGLGREWLHFHNILVAFSLMSNFLSRKRVINYCQLLLQFIIISI